MTSCLPPRKFNYNRYILKATYSYSAWCMAQQPQQSQGDNAYGPIWIVLGLFVCGYIVWKYGHAQIVSITFYVNLIQAKLINLFIQSTSLSNDIYMMETLNPASVTWDQLVQYTENVGSYSKYLVVFVLGVLAYYLYKSDITLRFRKVHDMKTLRIQEQANWPAIMPVVPKKLEEEDISTGVWAMALSPMEFARKYNLLKKDDVLLDNPVHGQEMTAGVRRGDAKRVFTLQLGPYWDGFKHCPPHAAALAAIFLSRANRDRDSATKILTSLDRGCAEGKMDYSLGLSVLSKYENTPVVQQISDKHAYLMTFMASLLQTARLDGVVPSSEFLWLKTVDRRLWYMLNCVGRQTPFAEVGGPFAHWRAEQVMGRRLLIPMIDEAIKALEVAVKEVKLSPQEMQELQP